MDKKPGTETDPIEVALEKIKALRSKPLSEQRRNSIEEDRVANLVPPPASARTELTKEKKPVLDGAQKNETHLRRMLPDY